MTTATMDSPATDTPAQLGSSMEHAIPLHVTGFDGRAQTAGNISDEQPRIFWSLTAPKSGTITLDWQKSAGSDIDPVLRVHSAAGELLAENDDAEARTRPIPLPPMPPPEGPQWPEIAQGAQDGMGAQGAQAVPTRDSRLQIPVTAGQLIFVEGTSLADTRGHATLFVRTAYDGQAVMDGPQPAVRVRSLSTESQYRLSSRSKTWTITGGGGSVERLLEQMIELGADPHDFTLHNSTTGHTEAFIET